MNYKVLAISVVASGIIFGYILLESKKLEDAADAHGKEVAELAVPER
jgi:hypothetical protein